MFFSTLDPEESGINNLTLAHPGFVYHYYYYYESWQDMNPQMAAIFVR